MDCRNYQLDYLLDCWSHVSAIDISDALALISGLTTDIVVPSSSIPSTNTSADVVRSSSLHAVSLLLRLVRLSPLPGKDSSGLDSSWVSVSVRRTLPSPSTPPRWLRPALEVPWSCFGSFGLSPVIVSACLAVSLIANHRHRYLLGFLRQRHCQGHR